MGTHKRASDTTYMIKAGLLPVEAMTGVGDNDTYVIRGPAIMKAGGWDFHGPVRHGWRVTASFEGIKPIQLVKMELEFRKGVPVVDSLRINERLEQLRAVDVRSVDKNDLIDLNQVTIDETKPVPERVAEFMRQIQNPYCFRIGDVVIKVVYKENGPSFQQNMIDMLQTVWGLESYGFRQNR